MTNQVWLYREIPVPMDVDPSTGKSVPAALLGRGDKLPWAVGFYNPHGDWQTESTHASAEKAAERVHWLNGGESRQERAYDNRIMEQLTHAIRNMPHTVRMRPF